MITAIVRRKVVIDGVEYYPGTSVELEDERFYELQRSKLVRDAQVAIVPKSSVADPLAQAAEALPEDEADSNNDSNEESEPQTKPVRIKVPRKSRKRK